MAGGRSLAQAVHFGGIQTTITNTFTSGPGIVVDSAGDLFVSDDTNDQIVETTAAGATVIISTGGAKPQYLALDSSNNLYATTTVPSVLKIPSNGAGGYGSPAILLQSGLAQPLGIAVDSSGNVFVVDTGLGELLKLSYSAGYYTMSMFLPHVFGLGQMAIDGANNLYLGNMNGNIEKITPAAVTSTIPLPPFGSNPVGIASDAAGNLAFSEETVLDYMAYNAGAYTPTLLNNVSTQIQGIAFDPAGNIYVSEGSTQILHQTVMNGNFGSINVGTASQAATLVFVFDTDGSLNAYTPMEALTEGQGGLDFSATGGTCTAGASFSVNDTCTVTATLTPGYAGLRNGAIVLYGSAGALAGTGYIYGVGLGPEIAFPLVQTSFSVSGDEVLGVALDGDQNLYLALSGSSNELVKATLSGGNYMLASTPIDSTVSVPNGVRVDGAGNVYVADREHGEVAEEVLSAGAYSRINITSGLSEPTDLVVDEKGNVFVADRSLTTIAEEPLINGTFGTYIPIGSGLSAPSGITIDAAGNLYVVDSGNNRVVKETLANGVYTQTDLIDGLPSPSNIAIDAAGNLYITENANNVVIKETLSGGTYTPSTLPFTGLSGPLAIAIDSMGNLYVADQYGDSVVFGQVTAPPPLTFASTAYNTLSSDSPHSIAVTNNGNLPLIFTAPVSGTNPTTATSFPFDSSTTCPFGTPSGSGSVAAGSLCSFAFDFIPQAIGNISKSSILSTNITEGVYNFALSGTATRASQTISFTLPSSLAYLSGETVALSATASSGLAISYIVSGPATISGSTLTITGTGTVSVTARQSGNADYTAATSAIQTIAITAAPITNTSFPATAVGSSAAAVQVTVLITKSGTAASIAVLTKGAPGLDFQSTTGGTCATATAYVEGSTCTVNVVFGPKYSGIRYGGVVLTDANNNILGNTYLQGQGLGPQIVFPTHTGPAPVTLLAYSSTVSNLQRVAVDGSGNLFIAGYTASSVEELPVAENYGTAPTLVSSDFNDPFAVAVDGSGNLFVVDSTTKIKEILATGNYSTPPITLGAVLSDPTGIAVDGNGNLFVTDTGDQTVKEIPAAGNYSSSVVLVNNLEAPEDIAVDGNGNVFVANYNPGTVIEIPAAGGYSTPPITLSSGFLRPESVAVDGNGNVFVADSANGYISEILVAGNYSTPPIVLFQTPPGRAGVAVDGSGNVFIPFDDEAFVPSLPSPYGPLVELTFATAPTLSFPSTATGVTSAPLTVDLINNGNEPLTLPVPAMGTDPQTGVNFALETNSDTTCSIANAGGTAGILAADAQCVLSYTFDPTAVGTLNSTSVLTDNALNMSGTMQTIVLTGVATQGTQSSQTITFPQPTQTIYPGSVTLTATASSGLPVSYTVVSGSAVVSGSTLTYTDGGTVRVEASQAGNAIYTAAPNQYINIVVNLAQAAINWSPSALKIYTGTPLGASVLDATDSVPATITYSAALQPSGRAQSVSTTTVLTQGSYNLAALITPQDATNYAITTDTFLFTVQNMNVFVGNAQGSVFSFYNNGTQQSSPMTGGGIGAAVDSSGSVWSINTGGSGIAKFNDAGILSASYNSVAGINAAAALAIDGNSTIWVANGNGTISALNNDGTAAAATTMSAAYHLSSPASIAIDSAGSLWVANSGNNTITEIIGTAAPVTAPAVDAVINSTMGTRP